MKAITASEFKEVLNENIGTRAIRTKIEVALKRREKLERVVDVLIDDLDPDMNRHRIAEIRDNLIRLRSEAT